MLKLFILSFLLTSSIFALDTKTQNIQIVKLAATEMSKSLPQIIDRYTKITNIVADKTTLVYIYEISSDAKNDDTIKKENHSNMREAITLGTCKNSKRFLDSNISIRYIYKSAKTKAELFRFDINRGSCIKS